jgi:hypothetical protein
VSPSVEKITPAKTRKRPGQRLVTFIASHFNEKNAGLEDRWNQAQIPARYFLEQLIFSLLASVSLFLA